MTEAREDVDKMRHRDEMSHFSTSLRKRHDNRFHSFSSFGSGSQQQMIYLILKCNFQQYTCRIKYKLDANDRRVSIILDGLNLFKPRYAVTIGLIEIYTIFCLTLLLAICYFVVPSCNTTRHGLFDCFITPTSTAGRCLIIELCR